MSKACEYLSLPSRMYADYLGNDPCLRSTRQSVLQAAMTGTINACVLAPSGNERQQRVASAYARAFLQRGNQSICLTRIAYSRKWSNFVSLGADGIVFAVWLGTNLAPRRRLTSVLEERASVALQAEHTSIVVLEKMCSPASCCRSQPKCVVRLRFRSLVN